MKIAARLRRTGLSDLEPGDLDAARQASALAAGPDGFVRGALALAVDADPAAGAGSSAWVLISPPGGRPGLVCIQDALRAVPGWFVRRAYALAADPDPAAGTGGLPNALTAGPDRLVGGAHALPMTGPDPAAGAGALADALLSIPDRFVRRADASSASAHCRCGRRIADLDDRIRMHCLPSQTGLLDGQTHFFCLRLKTRPPEQIWTLGRQT